MVLVWFWYCNDDCRFPGLREIVFAETSVYDYCEENYGFFSKCLRVEFKIQSSPGAWRFGRCFIIEWRLFDVHLIFSKLFKTSRTIRPSLG